MALNYYDLNEVSIENRFAGSVHGHAILDVTGLRAELDATQSGLTSTSDILFNDATIYGNMVPNVDGTQNLGSSSKHFGEAWIDSLHIAENTLYLGDTPVIGTDSGTVEVKADTDQGITIKTTGTGESKMISQNGIEISNSGMNGQVSIQSTGAGGQVSFGATAQLNFTAPESNISGELNVSGHSDFSSATFSGDVTFSGTNYTVDTTNVTTTDNRITLNVGEVGNGVTAGYAGFDIDRGTFANWQFVFDEANDQFIYGEVGQTAKIVTDKVYVDTALGAKLDTTTFNTTYTANDVLTKLKTVDGPGSLLDADTLDGYQAADLLMNANQIMDAVKSVDGDSSGLDADLLDGWEATWFYDGTNSYNSGHNGATMSAYSHKLTTYLIDSSTAAFTVYLPTPAYNGNKIKIVDVEGTFATNNFTINRNGHNINAVAEDLTCDVDDTSFELTYVDATIGWKIS